MRIGKDSKIGVALAVLRSIKMKASEVIVETYSNCREQGFYVISYYKDNAKYNERRAVSFAENRNSDDIIVQFGVRLDFNDYGVLSEAKYETNKKYFRNGDHEKAGEFARKWLVG